MNLEEKSKGTFGMGDAEIRITITRPDGVDDVVVFHKVAIREDDLSQLIIYEEQEIQLVEKVGPVLRSGAQHVKLVLGGQMLVAGAGGQLFEIKLGDHDESNDGG